MDPAEGQADRAAGRPILVASDIHRFYGTRRALRALSFTLMSGRVLGFLGPNGAGKTTSIRVLTTVLEPTSGRFEVDGVGSEDPIRIRRRIGVLPEGLGFPRHTSGVEYLTYYGQLYGRRSADARRTAHDLLETVGMAARGDSLIETYSHGMRQRLGIARALVNDPRVVFLDEPTLGLDPRGQQELLSMIQRIARERDAGVVLSSHLLSEIEGICDDVVIMNQGQIVAKGSVSDVLGRASADGGLERTVRVRVPPEQVDAAAASIAQVEHASVTDRDPRGWVSVRMEPADRAASDLERNAVLQAVIAAGIPVLGFELAGGRLQDVFLQLTAEAIA